MAVITYTQGCQYHGQLTIGDKNFYELSYDEQKKIVTKLIDKCPEDTLYEILSTICMNIGECKDYGICEDCGDYCADYSIPIKLLILVIEAT